MKVGGVSISPQESSPLSSLSLSTLSATPLCVGTLLENTKEGSGPWVPLAEEVADGAIQSTESVAQLNKATVRFEWRVERMSGSD